MNTPSFDQDKAHRWFAIECNNAAWDLVEAGEVPAEKVEALLNAAHASVFHWDAAGKPINHLRGLTLLIAAYRKVGFAESAVFYAQKCLALWNQLPAEDVTDFDAASVYGSALATSKVGDVGVSSDRLQTDFATALAKLDAEDRKVAESLWLG